MNIPLFQTGWFLYMMLAQMLLVFIIRTRKIPFVESMPSALLATLIIIIIACAFVLPFTPLAGVLHLVEMPRVYYFVLVVMVPVYLVAVWITKNWLVRRYAR